MEFSKDQVEAMDMIVDWYTSHRTSLQSFILGGAAGVGKSTLISYLKNYIHAEIVYVSYTGKASVVLKRKLKELGISADSVSTIHSLMYNPILDSNGDVVGWKRKHKIDADLIVVDEASMVPQEIYEDLQSYRIPVLYVGDHYQLPPVSKYDFNLMDKAFIKLETPQRFAEGSPIIKLATKIRNGEAIKYGEHGDGVSKRRISDITSEERKRFFQSKELKSGDSVILCGFNKTRVKLNKNVRATFGYKGLINDDERIICLKNARKSNIPLYNGSIGTVKYVQKRFEKAFKAHIQMDGFENFFIGNIYNDIFNTEKPDLYTSRDVKTHCFDYGYCVSVHKSQGSEWDRVCVFEEQCDLFDPHRWLYTAVTRSRGELLIVK